jgi:hypothetical protein
MLVVRLNVTVRVYLRQILTRIRKYSQPANLRVRNINTFKTVLAVSRHVMNNNSPIGWITIRFVRYYCGTQNELYITEVTLRYPKVDLIHVLNG